MPALDRAEGALLVAELALSKAAEIERAVTELSGRLKSALSEQLPTAVQQAVDAAISKMPPPKNGERGEPGRDGRDASDLQVIAKMIGDELQKCLPALISGIGFVSEDEGRTLALEAAVGETAVRREVKTALVLDRGVWREHAFEKGDGVTWAGSFFIARRATQPSEKPEECPDAWRLSIKRGRDGRNGKEGARGPQGERGMKGEQGHPGRASI